MLYAKLVWILLSIAISSGIILEAEWKSPQKIIPKDYPIIIGCINQYTGEIKKPLNQEYSACYYWSKWWKNLRFPSKKQYETMKIVYNTRAKMVTAMTLMNHESQFDSKAVGKHKYWKDCWIFQIRDIYWWCKMTDRQQMEWFNKRKEGQLSPKGTCYHRVQEWNREKLLKCVFNRHNGQTNPNSSYAVWRYEEWKFYNSLQF